MKKVWKSKLHSARLWFGIWMVILGLVLWYMDLINIKNNINNNTKDDSNPRLTKKYSYENINDIKLTDITWKIYISPIDTRKWWSQNISLLSPKNSNIYIRMYNITDDRAKQKLKQLASTHNVHMIYETLKHGENKPTEDYQWLTNSLQNNGIHIYNDKQMWVNFTHAKTQVGSNGYIIQTMNWTKSSFDSNREFMFVWNDRDIIDSLTYVFEQDVSGNKVDKMMIHPNLLICPIDCRSKIEYMIKSAQKSIYIYNQYISDDSIAKLLKDKISQKLDIKIILAKWDEDENNKKNFGNNYKGQSKPYPHAKVLLIDDKYLIISSINFSTNSMNYNREIWIIVTDIEAVSKFKKIFLQDWKK